ELSGGLSENPTSLWRRSRPGESGRNFARVVEELEPGLVARVDDQAGPHPAFGVLEHELGVLVLVPEENAFDPQFVGLRHRAQFLLDLGPALRRRAAGLLDQVEALLEAAVGRAVVERQARLYRRGVLLVLQRDD